MIPPPQHILVAGISQFLMESRPDVFSSWPVLRMHDWIRYHLHQRAIGVVAIGGVIKAVGVGWRGHAGDIDDRWNLWDDTGTVFYFDQLHSKDPQALATLIELFTARVPDWQSLTLIADRRGRRIFLDPAMIHRLLKRATARKQ